MGARAFTNPEEAEHFLHAEFIGTEQQRRDNAALIDRERKRIVGIMTDQHAESERYITRELESVLRICPEGEETVDGILTDLRNGDISAREAATALGAARRDLNKLRNLVNDLPATEERAWEQVNKTPGEFMADVAKRFPALFGGGRNQIVLTTNDD